MHKKRSNAWVFVFLAMAITGISIMLRPNRSTDPTQHPAVGSNYPGFNVLGLAGVGSEEPQERVGLEDVSGKVVLLNLWGPWCPPCRRELPGIDQIARDYRTNPKFQLLAVSFAGSVTDPALLESNTRDFLQEMNLTLPAYTDIDGFTLTGAEVALDQQGLSLPTTFLIDAGGVIRAVWIGYQSGDEDKMRALIDKLLEEEPVAA